MINFVLKMINFVLKMMNFAGVHMLGGADAAGAVFASKTRNYALKTRNYALKTMNCASKTWNCALKTRNYALKTMNCASKPRISVLKMMIYVDEAARREDLKLFAVQECVIACLPILLVAGKPQPDLSSAGMFYCSAHNPYCAAVLVCTNKLRRPYVHLGCWPGGGHNGRKNSLGGSSPFHITLKKGAPFSSAQNLHFLPSKSSFECKRAFSIEES